MARVIADKGDVTMMPTKKIKNQAPAGFTGSRSISPFSNFSQFPIERRSTSKRRVARRKYPAIRRIRAERRVELISGFAPPSGTVCCWHQGDNFGFIGIVDEIQPEKEKVRALISIFGRETPVELEFYQIEKV